MLFAVRMAVSLPPDMDPEAKDSVVAAEREYAQKLQHAGEWLHLWRCVGQYSNLSIFDVTDNDRLNEILWGLPLFAFMDITVTPLARHPSAVR
ncbi:muconolactone Delta-isomerase [Streptomyces violaceusniger]|uniref:Muconolactone Delta-isomerase n=1 Tax=Streptomyces violaceusniger TaxID=68280 RepID=A0A4D4KVJ0_STRVO|nr:muconolactone Delta-isomerase [Streptomyces violaceusniger]